MAPRFSLRNMALALTALLIPFSMLIGNLVTAFYKSSNPREVDITADLAYLRESLVAGFGTALVIGLIVVWLLVRIYQRDKNLVEVKLPLTILVAMVIVVFAALGVNGYINAVEDQYRRDHPTSQS